MDKFLRFFLIPISQILAVICAFGIGFAQIPTLYLMLTGQASEGQPIFMDEVAPNLDDLIFRSTVTVFVFILACLIAYKGKQYLSKSKD